jgi:hypothetical protein
MVNNEYATTADYIMMVTKIAGSVVILKSEFTRMYKQQPLALYIVDPTSTNQAALAAVAVA